MRIKRAILPLVLIQLAAFFSFGYGQEGPAQGMVSERWYLLNIKDKPSGYVQVMRKVCSENAAQASFEYKIMTNTEKEQISLKMQAVCDDDEYLFPISILAEIRKLGQAPATLRASVEKETSYGCPRGKMRAVYRTGDKTYNRDKDVPEHTVTEYGLLEIVPRLPFVEGPVFRFNLLLVSKLEVKKNHEIKYKGLDEVKVNNTSRMLHKFQQKGSGIRQIDYWVDDNHQLIRVLRDKKEEFVLSSQAEVTRVSSNWPSF